MTAGIAEAVVKEGNNRENNLEFEKKLITSWMARPTELLKATRFDKQTSGHL